VQQLLALEREPNLSKKLQVQPVTELFSYTALLSFRFIFVIPHVGVVNFFIAGF
jgi:hypothetical protein